MEKKKGNSFSCVAPTFFVFFDRPRMMEGIEDLFVPAKSSHLSLLVLAEQGKEATVTKIEASTSSASLTPAGSFAANPDACSFADKSPGQRVVRVRTDELASVAR